MGFLTVKYVIDDYEQTFRNVKEVFYSHLGQLVK